MSAPGFVHLRLHSEYSLADSIIQVKPLAAAVRERQMPAVALTDRSNLFGLIKFYRACLDQGVKPLIGVDVRYSSEISSQGVPEICRAAVLAMNQDGYRNLLKLVSEAYQSGSSRGVLDRQQLFERGEGLLVLCGGREGEVGRALLKGERDLARRLASEWSAGFADRFYLELVRSGRADEQRHVAQAVSLAT